MEAGPFPVPDLVQAGPARAGAHLRQEVQVPTDQELRQEEPLVLMPLKETGPTEPVEVRGLFRDIQAVQEAAIHTEDILREPAHIAEVLPQEQIQTVERMAALLHKEVPVIPDPRLLCPEPLVITLEEAVRVIGAPEVVQGAIEVQEVVQEVPVAA